MVDSFPVLFWLSVLSRINVQDGKSMSEAKLTKVFVTVRSTSKTKETKVSRDKAIEFQLISEYDKEKEVRQGKSAPEVSNADGDKGNAP